MLRDLFSLFPAYAGVILNIYANIMQNIPFPRIRGGDPLPLIFVGTPMYFSPHTRG